MSNVRKSSLSLTTVLIIALSIVFLIKFFIDYDQIQNFPAPAIVLFIELSAIVLLFGKSQQFRNIIGESDWEQLSWRVTISAFIFLTFSIYLILNDELNTFSSGFFLIAPTIGAIISTISSNARLNPQTQEELINASKKLILSTVLLLIAVPSLYFIDNSSLNGINLYQFAFDSKAITRFFFFWITGTPLFYGGLFLFSLGIIDLVWAFRYPLKETRKIQATTGNIATQGKLKVGNRMTPIEAIEKEAKRIEEDALLSFKGHFNDAAFYNTLYYSLAIPTIVFASIASFTAFVSVNILSGISALIAAVLSGTNILINPIEKSKSHHEAGAQLQGLRDRIRLFTEVDLRAGITAKVLTIKIQEFSQEKNSINKCAPAISKRAYGKAKDGISKGEASYQVDKN
ncbi:hypothetical protein Dform_02043 [Dehalogenimonas formicexedens]|uniref:SMODS and SLOG-associating 2TM effector domain-containing protein n=1 Tax=Dehalogenimonas formicexedens TaxID=1839801 RepID=A0A1P8FA65_9CHLR|nr:SLATT domain-containing protein [Dehalogenimonas formicexedens]APV45352.1 hypothetical protein Dform_02043 [Dehalogenimonas formicexedens]